eukprot:4264039-Lingulodinium_polyedra.AAC.1
MRREPADSQQLHAGVQPRAPAVAPLCETVGEVVEALEQRQMQEPVFTEDQQCVNKGIAYMLQQDAV